MLKLVAVDAGEGCVLPDTETIATGEYRPLTRPLFVYANKAALERDAVISLVKYYFSHVGTLASEVGYVPLPDDHYQRLLERIGR
jgi:phosphate transport system substrate-binding protein